MEIKEFNSNMMGYVWNIILARASHAINLVGKRYLSLENFVLKMSKSGKYVYPESVTQNSKML